MTYRFHILGIPHTATHRDYSACAFTQKVRNICAMLHRRGHHVIHYGNELSNPECDEHVTVASAGEITSTDASGFFDISMPVYGSFVTNAIAKIGERKQPRDFLLCMFGVAHKPIADAFPELICVEAGIGYPSGHFAPFKVFESYAMLHAYRGLAGVETANGNGWWYDVVIPNYFDLNDFKFSAAKGQYFLFLGLRACGGMGKGMPIAVDIAGKAGVPLWIAGQGRYDDAPSHVKFCGFAGPDERRELLAGAAALLAPSLFLEPFCGASIEALLSGTPVICSDWGAFAENIEQGVTGYRCRMFEQFLWAANNIDRISRQACRDFAAANFSLDHVGDMYEEYFWSLMQIYTGNGWYQPKPERAHLNWLARKTA